MNFQNSQSQKQISNPIRVSHSYESSQPQNKPIFKSDQKPSQIESSLKIRNSQQEEKYFKNVQIFEIDELQDKNDSYEIKQNLDDNRKSQNTQSKTLKTENRKSQKQIRNPIGVSQSHESPLSQIKSIIKSDSKNSQIETSSKYRNSQQAQKSVYLSQIFEQEDKSDSEPNINNFRKSQNNQSNKTSKEYKNSLKEESYFKKNDQRNSKQSYQSDSTQNQSNLRECSQSVNTQTNNQTNIRKDQKVSCIQVQCNVF